MTQVAFSVAPAVGLSIFQSLAYFVPCNQPTSVYFQHKKMFVCFFFMDIKKNLSKAANRLISTLYFLMGLLCLGPQIAQRCIWSSQPTTWLLNLNFYPFYTMTLQGFCALSCKLYWLTICQQLKVSCKLLFKQIFLLLWPQYRPM